MNALAWLAKMFGSAIVGALWHKLQMWWARKQAEYYQKKAELEEQRAASLKQGKAAEEDIRKAGDTVIIHANKAAAWADRVAQLEQWSKARSEAKEKQDA